MKASFLLFLLSFTAALVFVAGNSGCANIIPPAGGPRDSLAPRLVNASPPDSSLNFRGERITLSFDEYVDLRDVQNNLLFTPLFENNPLVTVRLRTVTIRFRDSLESNTTYTLNFGNSIVDINEGNVLRNFDYTFSTGATLDSLEFSGRVVMAENGGIDTTLQVLLHRSLEDSAVAKQRPRYATRLDRNGNFRFTNLPPGRFAVYALGDAGSLRRYTSRSQYFAFADSPITIGAGADSSLTLYAYREAAPTQPGAAPAAPRNTGNNATNNRLQFTTNLNNNQQDLLQDLVLTFPTPLRRFDSAGLQLAIDSIFTPTPFSARLDSTRKELRLTTAWQEGRAYNLIINREFATDTLNRQLLKTDTLEFNTRRAAEYGSLVLRVGGLKGIQNPVLQFVQNNTVVFSTPIATGSYSIRLFLPGEYELRILEDRNKNGKWDGGQFFGKRIQPERVRSLGQNITVRPAYDNEIDRALQGPF